MFTVFERIAKGKKKIERKIRNCIIFTGKTNPDCRIPKLLGFFERNCIIFHTFVLIFSYFRWHTHTVCAWRFSSSAMPLFRCSYLLEELLNGCLYAEQSRTRWSHFFIWSPSRSAQLLPKFRPFPTPSSLPAALSCDMKYGIRFITPFKNAHRLQARFMILYEADTA